ncbi:hypothetical protein PLESTB_000705500 [Pleodorina starrii]|uniref:lipoyl(octanoyl) transferase n=1 Tax=Pleodorina starrii TaxID=330485 RepID=A0A9W6B9K8_9CHLO|nr:hypothetical protein PLESTB_000050100 [Pleodorina starrii]GLC53079.1 hypothetical protein PLESTB_000705500 [Pleodorina starrii]
MAARLHPPPSGPCSSNSSRRRGPSAKAQSPPAPAAVAPPGSHRERSWRTRAVTPLSIGWQRIAAATTTDTAHSSTPSRAATSPPAASPTSLRAAASLPASRPSACPRALSAARPTHGSGPVRFSARVDAAEAVAAGAAEDAGVGGAGAGTDPRVVVVYDLSDQVVEYEQAWAWQRALLERVSSASTASTASGSASIDAAEGTQAGGRPRGRGARHCLLLLQHPPVYTLGAGSTTDHLRFPPGSSPIPLHRTERGGEVTYHGPGQLVMYPILDLQALKPDLHWYLRQLEQVVIEALDSVSGLKGERLEGLTGVWVEGAKVAAIGVRAKRWVSYHGLALNVVTDLAPFTRIVPCGIADRPVTSVRALLEARRAAEDPFAPPGTDFGLAAAAGAGGGGGGDDGMIPLAQATQEDLRRMLAATGMSPPLLQDTAPPPPPPPDGPQALAPALDLDLDDPFAAPLSSSPPPPARDGSGGPAAAAPEAPPAAGGAAGAAAAAAGALQVRSDDCTEVEALLLREYGCALKEAFSEVFGLELVEGDPGELGSS